MHPKAITCIRSLLKPKKSIKINALSKGQDRTEHQSNKPPKTNLSASKMIPLVRVSSSSPLFTTSIVPLAQPNLIGNKNSITPNKTLSKITQPPEMHPSCPKTNMTKS
jgi:hypothetical protein